DAGNAFLTDFGIIKVHDETSKITETGSVVGTPAYISPEQWTGRPVDGRSDVYALGVCLYEMLTGNVPFQGETLYSMMQLHLNELPPPVHTVRKGLSPRYAQILDKALAKNPELRYSKSGDLAAAFSEVVSAPAGPTAGPAAPRGVSETAPVARQPTRSASPMPPVDDRTSAIPMSMDMDDGRTGAIPMPSVQSGSVYETTPLPVGASASRMRPAAPTPSPAATRRMTPPRETGGRSRLPLIIGALAVIGIVVVAVLALASRGGEADQPTPTTGAALVASDTSAPPSETPVPTTESAPATATAESIVVLASPEATEAPTEPPTEPPSNTPAATATDAATRTPAATATRAATATSSDLIAVLASPTRTFTVTPSITVTNTPTLTLTPTRTVPITNTPPPTLTPTATATNTALPSATPTPDPAQTATAFALATAQKIGADVSAIVRTGQQAFGPESGQLPHPEGSSLSEARASASLINFVAEARFINPYDAAEGAWDYGFIFRAVDADTQYRLLVRSKGDYALVLRERGEVSLVANEPVANLNVAAGGSNVLRLAVNGDKGALFVNGRLAAELDLSALGRPGDVAVATAFLAENRIAGRATRYEDFTIWIPALG
ncbi:MAG: protein kinase, partial [Anaerolineae bacterium]|nr:protein kinase [Anaerolineae bacterium]